MQQLLTPQKSSLDLLIDQVVEALCPTERAEDAVSWKPFENSPQEQAYYSEADELFYGGAAGGGKTDLAIGLAATTHYNSLILRREAANQLDEIIARSNEVMGDRAKYNKTTMTWLFPNGRRVKFGGCEGEDDKQKYKGRPKDLYVFDELPDFTESQYLFVTTWNRSVRPGQRCRVVGTGNPPSAADGEWVIRRWAPWLDPKHPHPALPGELRWYAIVATKEVERENGEPFIHDGELITPRSRTFIPAKLEDNPILNATNYRARLQGLEEPLRSQMLYGDFAIGLKDDAWQVIPTGWVRQAQARWEALEEQAQEEGKEHYHPVVLDDQGNVQLDEAGEEIPAPLTSAGVDVARGGDDELVVSKRINNWFAALEAWPGTMVPNGPAGAGLVTQSLSEEAGDVSNAYINVDSIGVGASVYDVLSEQGLNVLAINFAARAYGTDRTGLHSFVNLRAYGYWSLREALDPERGDNIALPPGQKLLGDLTAPRWRQRTNGIQIEDKEEIKKRLGRSPDEGDAVVLAALPDFGPRLS